MTKIVITENQLKKLTRNLNENYVDLNDTYKQECNVDLNYYGLKFKGYEINDVTTSNMVLTFLIDMSVKSYGIRDISVYGVKGPSEIELEVSYWLQEDGEDSTEETVVLPINWENVEMQEDETLGYIGISNLIQIDLGNNESGELVVDGVIVNYSKSI
jgi:hypothetical protein